MTLHPLRGLRSLKLVTGLDKSSWGAVKCPAPWKELEDCGRGHRLPQGSLLREGTEKYRVRRDCFLWHRHLWGLGDKLEHRVWPEVPQMDPEPWAAEGQHPLTTDSCQS